MRVTRRVEDSTTAVLAELDLRAEVRTLAAAHTAAHGGPVTVPAVQPGPVRPTRPRAGIPRRHPGHRACGSPTPQAR
ncbi:hypothetical protein [Streptomyces sp. NPDC002640]